MKNNIVNKTIEEMEKSGEIMEIIENLPKEASKEIVVEMKNPIEVGNDNVELVSKRINNLNLVSGAIHKALIDGIDYGVIPSTKKPSLFKSGAEKICLLYGLRAKPTMNYKENLEDGWLEYSFSTDLVDGNGNFIANGVGVCGTRERKYSNQNCWDIKNTILKMAKKRALVDAVLMIGNLSEVFTQDVEDMSLSTQNAIITLTRDEKFGLYSLAYSHWDKIMEKYPVKKDGKQAVANHLIKNVFPKIGIEKRNFMAFDKADADKFREYINGGGE